MILTSLEWRFPLHRGDRHFMAPPLGLDQFHGTLFADNGDAWNQDEQTVETHWGIGLELHMDAFFGYFVPLEIRAGLAYGANKGGETQTYVQGGRSF